MLAFFVWYHQHYWLLISFLKDGSFATMFETYHFSKTLDEEVFDTWLSKGRDSKIGYKYLLVIWDTWEEAFKPIYYEGRDELLETTASVSPSEVVVAAYDLYSESKISTD